jgi:hypothetical protein
MPGSAAPASTRGAGAPGMRWRAAPAVAPGAEPVGGRGRAASASRSGLPALVALSSTSRRALRTCRYRAFPLADAWALPGRSTRAGEPAPDCILRWRRRGRRAALLARSSSRGVRARTLARHLVARPRRDLTRPRAEQGSAAAAPQTVRAQPATSASSRLGWRLKDRGRHASPGAPGQATGEIYVTGCHSGSDAAEICSRRYGYSSTRVVEYSSGTGVQLRTLSYRIGTRSLPNTSTRVRKYIY